MKNRYEHYDEVAERRRFLWSHFDIKAYQTEREEAVFLAIEAEWMKSKIRFQLPHRKEKWLEQISSALPFNDPLVCDELRDGLEAFRDRVMDRIWNQHRNSFVLNRCSACDRIVASPQAQQCLWCGFDWHGLDQCPASKPNPRGG